MDGPEEWGRFPPQILAMKNRRGLTAAEARVLEAAVAHAPPEYGTSSNEELLPRRRRRGRCRLCGEVELLSPEHIPPRATGNKGDFRWFTFQDWIEGDTEDFAIGAGRKAGGGLSGFTLCTSCNNATGGGYGGEYKRWAEFGFDLLTRLPLDDFEQSTHAHAVHFAVEPVQPGRFIRQVLSMFCSLTGSWRITELHPELKAIVLNGETLALPEPLELTMALCAGPRARLVGPQLLIEEGGECWAWVAELAHPPFALAMKIVASDTYTLPGIHISHFTEVDLDRKCRFEPEEMQVGFSVSPYLLDYRSPAAIKSER